MGAICSLKSRDGGVDVLVALLDDAVEAAASGLDLGEGRLVGVVVLLFVVCCLLFVVCFLFFVCCYVILLRIAGVVVQGCCSRLLFVVLGVEGVVGVVGVVLLWSVVLLWGVVLLWSAVLLRGVCCVAVVCVASAVVWSLWCSRCAVV